MRTVFTVGLFVWSVGNANSVSARWEQCVERGGFFNGTWAQIERQATLTSARNKKILEITPRPLHKMTPYFNGILGNYLVAHVLFRPLFSDFMSDQRKIEPGAEVCDQFSTPQAKKLPNFD